jgi:Fic family protein
MARPSRQTVYARLARAVEDLAGVGGLPLPEEAAAIWRDIWYEETHHSTAIEGNTLVLKQVQLLLFEGKAVGSKELREYLEVQAYADAADWVYAQAIRDPKHSGHDRRVTLTEIREIHRRTVDTVWAHFPPDHLDPKETAGSFRRHDIEAFPGGMKPPPFVDVQPLLTDWVQKVNKRRPPVDRPVVEELAEYHADFERIHPFRDGNGRVGRLLLNLLLVRSGYPPAVIYKKDRATYMRGLARADDGDPGLLGELLARSVTHSIERFILPGLAGPLKLVPLAALVNKDASQNALVLAAQRGRLNATQRGGQWYSSKQAVDEYLRNRYKRSGPGRP